MNILKTVTFLVGGSLSLFMSFAFGMFITEKFFFDEIHYQKSEQFGYFPDDENDINVLTRSRMTGFDLLASDGKTENVLGTQSDKDTFTIAVIGDSLVWGLGIKQRERFSEILNRKLNTVRKTKVVNLGYPGDNFLDNLSKYILLDTYSPQDLYVFIVFSNDIFLWPEERYHTASQNAILKQCEQLGPYLYDGDFPQDIHMDNYTPRMRQAWKNEANVCLITEGVKLLPHNAIYLMIDNHSENTDYDEAIRILSEQGLSVQSIFRNSPGIEAYRPYFENPQKYFSVSQIELHPSALANRMIADYLYTEITSNDRWKFSHK